MKIRFLAAALAASALCAPAAAQPVAPPSNLPLADRVTALEARVAQLERRLAPPSNLPAPAAAAPATAAPTYYLVGNRLVPEAEFHAGTAAPLAGGACAGGSCSAPAGTASPRGGWYPGKLLGR